jgi:hypothetical protein
LARAVEINANAGTATDVSVSIDAYEVDPDNAMRVMMARLDEISVCTTGFGADEGADLDRLQRLGIADVQQVLDAIADLRRVVLPGSVPSTDAIHETNETIQAAEWFSELLSSLGGTD